MRHGRRYAARVARARSGIGRRFSLLDFWGAAPTGPPKSPLRHFSEGSQPPPSVRHPQGEDVLAGALEQLVVLVPVALAVGADDLLVGVERELDRDGLRAGRLLDRRADRERLLRGVAAHDLQVLDRA